MIVRSCDSTFSITYCMCSTCHTYIHTYIYVCIYSLLNRPLQFSLRKCSFRSRVGQHSVQMSVRSSARYSAQVYSLLSMECHSQSITYIHACMNGEGLCVYVCGTKCLARTTLNPSRSLAPSARPLSMDTDSVSCSSKLYNTLIYICQKFCMYAIMTGNACLHLCMYICMYGSIQSPFRFLYIGFRKLSWQNQTSSGSEQTKKTTWSATICHRLPV